MNRNLLFFFNGSYIKKKKILIYQNNVKGPFFFYAKLMHSIIIQTFYFLN